VGSRVRLVLRDRDKSIYAAKSAIILTTIQDALAEKKIEVIEAFKAQGAAGALKEGEWGRVVAVADDARQIHLDKSPPGANNAWIAETNLAVLDPATERAELAKKAVDARRVRLAAEAKKSEAEARSAMKSAREIETSSPLAAVRAYKRLIKMWPNSNEATEAAERIKALESADSESESKAKTSK
jgi:hypothetical protein